MRQSPTGTVTFLFSDIEGSTRRWDLMPREMSPTLARHDALVRAAIEAHSGFVFKSIGDAFCAVFSNASEALETALTVQQGLRALPSSGEPAEEIALRVRIALNSGSAEWRDGDYFGQVLNRVDRLVEVGYGGEVKMSYLWRSFRTIGHGPGRCSPSICRRSACSASFGVNWSNATVCCRPRSATVRV